VDSVRSTAGPKKRANTTAGLLPRSRNPRSNVAPPTGFEPALPPPESGTRSNTGIALTRENELCRNAGAEDLGAYWACWQRFASLRRRSRVDARSAMRSATRCRVDRAAGAIQSPGRRAVNSNVLIRLGVPGPCGVNVGYSQIAALNCDGSRLVVTGLKRSITVSDRVWAAQSSAPRSVR
jgi:hypothetical protein